ncbi:hypothetical protein FBY21_2593 [Pseudomonas sp. SLBN-26]|uniref:DUF6575 domain-containing protein n=1 Tax=Pseudomonadaceae TaxID=135621 RepID=UPI0011532582|nr:MULTISPECIES: DUF6575 domain-containing protein [Pseudomonas]MCP1617975.1 hypothetical protein [Pseudomonas otitidis]TQL07214.1 hypothetical protein FBY21_2593 [Pseudomonas sp. SLBN-26]
MKLPSITGEKLEPKFFSKHTWNADLIDCEGPLLSLYRDEQGQDLLYMWLDCTESTNRWGVIPVSRSNLRGYLELRVTLRKIFIDSPWIAVFSTGVSAKRRNSAKKTTCEDLPEDYLPDEDSFLTSEIATEAASKLAEEVSEEYFLGLDGDMYIDDIAAIPRIYQQLYSFHYGLEHLHRTAIQSTLGRLAGNWTGGFSAVHLFSGLNQVTPSIHRAQVVEMRYNSPGHIKLDLLPALAKQIEISARQLIDKDAYMALEDFYSSTYRYFKENNINGFDDERDSVSQNLPSQVLQRLDELVTFFFRLMRWEDYRAQFGELQLDSLHQLRALLAYYRRLKKLKPYLESDKLFLGKSRLQDKPSNTVPPES